MDEVLRPLFDRVVKVINGEEIGCINTGIPDAFEQVAKELIGYNCFSHTVRMALVYNLERCISIMRKNDIVNAEVSHTEYGDVNSDIDIALDLAQTVIPNVLQVSYKDRYGKTDVIKELFAFTHYDKRDMETIFEILGNKFQDIYEERYFYRQEEGNTEEIYEAIVNIATMPF